MGINGEFRKGVVHISCAQKETVLGVGVVCTL